MSIKKIVFVFVIFFSYLPLPLFAAAEVSPLIETDVCKKPVAQGGWGGDCYIKAASWTDGCTGNTKFVGYCGGVNASNFPVESCCIPEAANNNGPIVGQFMEFDNICTLPVASGGNFGGTCQGSCDSATEDYIGICGESDSMCCTKKGSVATPSGTGGIIGAGGGLGYVGNVNTGTTYTPLENVPLVNGTTFQSYISGLYTIGLVLVVLSALFMLVVGGFMYLTSAGNTSQISSAKHVIQGALFGLALALVSFIILNTINPDLVNVNITSFQPMAAGTGSGGGGGNGGGGSCATIPASELVTVQGFQMLKSAATNFAQMESAAKASGITLTLTSGYRSPDRQLEIWNQYGCSRTGGKTVCSKGGSVAVPCALGGSGSNHSRGDAVDINVGCSNGQAGCNTPTYQWLKANGSQWNFRNSVPTDPVHWSATGN